MINNPKETVPTYTVVKGDYLIKIGKKLGIKWQTIAKLNNLSSPYAIKTGQKLKLPTETVVVITPIGVNDKVKIIGKKYATGQTVPSWVKLKTYTVAQINSSKTKARLKEINSWVYINDINKV